MTVPSSKIADISQQNIYECLICLEYIQADQLLDLQEIDYSIRICNCKGHFHKACFYTWYRHNSSCPICTLELVINNFKQNKKYCHICLAAGDSQRHCRHCGHCLHCRHLKCVICILYILCAWMGCVLLLGIIQLIVLRLHNKI